MKEKMMMRLLKWAAAVLFLFVASVVLNVVAEHYLGGEHVVQQGTSFGFTIGMTKAEVFDKYFALEKRWPNIRVADSLGTGNLTDHPDDTWYMWQKPKDGKMGYFFETSDHWMGFRDKWPVYFQDFYFSNGRLTKISTYIRFYETP